MMTPTRADLYRRAVDLLGGLKAATAATGGVYRTLQDRRRGRFDVTAGAARTMAEACRVRADELNDAADALDAAADEPTTTPSGGHHG